MQRVVCFAARHIVCLCGLTDENKRESERLYVWEREPETYGWDCFFGRQQNGNGNKSCDNETFWHHTFPVWWENVLLLPSSSSSATPTLDDNRGPAEAWICLLDWWWWWQSSCRCYLMPLLFLSPSPASVYLFLLLAILITKWPSPPALLSQTGNATKNRILISIVTIELFAMSSWSLLAQLLLLLLLLSTALLNKTTIITSVSPNINGFILLLHLSVFPFFPFSRSLPLSLSVSLL